VTKVLLTFVVFWYSNTCKFPASEILDLWVSRCSVVQWEKTELGKWEYIYLVSSLPNILFLIWLWYPSELVSECFHACIWLIYVFRSMALMFTLGLCSAHYYKSKSNLSYDEQSVIQALLVSATHLGPTTSFSYFFYKSSDSCEFLLWYTLSDERTGL
jgi:hypothetical protein